MPRAIPVCLLIAMATHGLSGPRRWLIGSVAGKVIQSAANPLLLIRPVEGADPSVPVKLDTVFVPLDGSGLAETTLPHVCALAKVIKSKAICLRAYTFPVNAYVVANGVTAQPQAHYREELKREAETYLDGKVAGLRADGFERVITANTREHRRRNHRPRASNAEQSDRNVDARAVESDAGCWQRRRKNCHPTRA